MTIDLAHVAMRPGWDCAACLQPWPCDAAREDLIRQTGGGTALAIAGWAYLEAWALDQGPGPVGEAFDRFIRWTRSAV